MSEHENGQPAGALQDPTTDRLTLLARVGEATMRLEAMAAAYEQLVAENVELKGRLAVLGAQSGEGVEDGEPAESAA